MCGDVWRTARSTETSRCFRDSESLNDPPPPPKGVTRWSSSILSASSRQLAFTDLHTDVPGNPLSMPCSTLLLLNQPARAVVSRMVLDLTPSTLPLPRETTRMKLTSPVVCSKVAPKTQHQKDLAPCLWGNSGICSSGKGIAIHWIGREGRTDHRRVCFNVAGCVTGKD